MGNLQSENKQNYDFIIKFDDINNKDNIKDIFSF